MSSPRPVASLMLDQLRAEGIRYVFGNPGTTEQPFMDALVDAPEIEYVLGLNEAVVVGAADAYARVTRRPAFVQLHIAAGLGNAIGMLYNAHRGRSPMVVYVGQSPQRALLREPHLTGDLIGMASPVSKWAYELRRPDDVLTALRRAFVVASSPPPGPAVLSIPIDILEDASTSQVVGSPVIDWATTPSEAAISAAAAVLVAAKRPLILVGDRLATAASPDETAAAAGQIRKIAAIIGAPVVQVYPSEIGLDAEDPLYAGNLGFTDAVAQENAYRDVDALLVVGGPIERVILAGDRSVLPETAWLVHVDDDLAQIGRTHARTVGVPGNVPRGLKALARAIADPARHHGSAKGGTWAEGHRMAIATGSALKRDRGDSSALRGYEAAASAVIRRLPSDGIVFDDAAAGSPHLFIAAKSLAGRYFKNRGGGLGAGIPGGIGLALGAPGHKVIAVVSDGSALFTIPGLWTAAHLRLDVVFLVLNNGGYQTLVTNMATYLGREGRPTIGTDLTEPPIDFVALATGFGLPACRVKREHDLDDALDSMVKLDGPGLIEFVVGDSA
jgi:benzoylformate decarboxylase